MKNSKLQHQPNIFALVFFVLFGIVFFIIFGTLKSNSASPCLKSAQQRKLLLTIPPSVEFILQPLYGVTQRLVFLFFFLILFLPLFCSELHIDTDCVLNGLCSTQKEKSLKQILFFFLKENNVESVENSNPFQKLISTPCPLTVSSVGLIQLLMDSVM